MSYGDNLIAAICVIVLAFWLFSGLALKTIYWLQAKLEAHRVRKGDIPPRN
jgi:hypothetical protein